MAFCGARSWRRGGWLDAIRSGKGALTLFRNLLPSNETPMRRAESRRRVAQPLFLLIAAFALLVAGGCTAGSLYDPKPWAAPVLLGDETVVIGTDTGHIVVGNIITGRELGRCETGEGRNSIRAIFGAPLLHDGRIYAGGFDGVLYAVDPASLLPESEAECIRFFEGDSPIVGGPALTADGVLLFGTEGTTDTRRGTLYAIDAQSAAPLWTFEADSEIWGTPVIGDGLVYVATLGGTMHAVHMDESPGTEAWRHQAEAGIGGMTLHEGVLYVGALDNNLYALDAATGRPHWPAPFTADNWFWAAPLVIGDRLFAPSLDHSLYILNKDTGAQVLDPVMTGGAIQSNPILTGSHISIANEEKETWWIDPQTGQGIVGGKLPDPVYAPIVSFGESDALFFAQDGAIYRASPSLRQPVRVFPVDS